MSADRRFLVYLVAMAATVAVLGSCSTPAAGPPERPLTVWSSTAAPSTDLQGATSCDRSFDPDDPIGALAAATDELARAIDETGPASGCAIASDPVCAALFLIGATDPVAATAAGLAVDDIERLTVLHHRVLVDGAEAARRGGDHDLETALRTMIDLDIRSTVGRGEEVLADVAVARIDPVIVDPIASAESRCR